MQRKIFKTEEYTYTLSDEDRTRTADWSDDDCMRWLVETYRFMDSLRTDDERAEAIRRKNKSGDFTEYIIQNIIYKNPDAWKYLPEGDAEKYEVGPWAKTEH